MRWPEPPGGLVPSHRVVVAVAFDAINGPFHPAIHGIGSCARESVVVSVKLESINGILEPLHGPRVIGLPSLETIVYLCRRHECLEALVVR